MGLVVLILVLLIVTALAGLAAYHLLEFSGVGTAVIVVICLLGTITIGSWNWATAYRGEHWATCHVTDKDRGGQDGSYRVYTTNCDTLANEDSVLRGKYDSSNVWQQIPDEGDIQVLIVGSRIPLFSQFANILEVKPAG
jgi:hypothetical protein